MNYAQEIVSTSDNIEKEEKTKYVLVIKILPLATIQLPKRKKHDNQVSRIRRRTLVGLGVEQSCQNSIPVEHCVNTCVPFKKTDKEPYNSGIFEPENPIHGIEGKFKILSN